MLLEDFSQERLQVIGNNSASFPARLAALDRIRFLEDQTRQTFGLPALTREPRPHRPATTRNRGGMGRGRTSQRARGRGRGRTRDSHGRGQAPTNRATGTLGRGSGGGAGGHPPLFLAPPPSLEGYAMRGIGRATSNSWFYAPPLLDVFRVRRPLPSSGFHGGKCKFNAAGTLLQRITCVAGLSSGVGMRPHIYIQHDNRELLMNLNDDAAWYIVHWTTGLRRTLDATVPLPNANFER